MRHAPVQTTELFTAETILASANADSVAVDLREITPKGLFSLHSILAGTGTAKWTYKLCSTEDGTYLTPADADNILTAQTVGTIFASIQPEIAPFIKINCEETGGANPITITSAWLNCQ